MSNPNTDDEFLNPDSPFERLLEHCESKKLQFTLSRERKRIRFNYSRPNVLYKCNLSICNDDDFFQVDIVLPVMANDEKMRPTLLEFFTRANFGLVLGGFQIDLRDGEICYHIGYLIPESGLSDETITRLVSVAMNTSDRYFSGIMRTLFGGETPEDAVYLCELDMHTNNAPDADNSPSPDEPLQLENQEQVPDEPQSEIQEEDEELVLRCLEIIAIENRASTSMLQRRLKLGYIRAARVMDILEERGIVGPKNGPNDREILVELDEIKPKPPTKKKKSASQKSPKKKNDSSSS
jgi:ribosomal protein S25